MTIPSSLTRRGNEPMQPGVTMDRLKLAEPLPILGNNTTSQPIRRLFLYSPLHFTNYITATSPLPIPV